MICGILCLRLVLCHCLLTMLVSTISSSRWSWWIHGYWMALTEFICYDPRNCFSMRHAIWLDSSLLIIFLWNCLSLINKLLWITQWTHNSFLVENIKIKVVYRIQRIRTRNRWFYFWFFVVLLDMVMNVVGYDSLFSIWYVQFIRSNTYALS